MFLNSVIFLFLALSNKLVKKSSKKDFLLVPLNTFWTMQIKTHPFLGEQQMPSICVTKLGDFWYFYGSKFLTKEAQASGGCLGFLKTWLSKLKLMRLLFGQILEQFGLLIVPTFGHTACLENLYTFHWGILNVHKEDINYYKSNWIHRNGTEFESQVANLFNTMVVTTLESQFTIIEPL